MTMPCERFAAVKNAHRFLWALLDPSATPRVPRAIRQRARACLKHYPADHDVDRWHTAVGDDWPETQEREGG